MSKVFSTDEVASRNKSADLLIIINDDVYDLTQFQEDHPGGKKSKWFHSALITLPYLTWQL
jgi:cytochrome b involved in lipid metabolism